jgi:hypothetical protein
MVVLQVLGLVVVFYLFLSATISALILLFSVCLSVLYILPLMRGVRYMCCFSFCTGAGPSLSICVGTFGDVGAVCCFPPGVSVVLVFSLVAGRVSSVLSCTCNVALSGGTVPDLRSFKPGSFILTQFYESEEKLK